MRETTAELLKRILLPSEIEINTKFFKIRLIEFDFGHIVLASSPVTNKKHNEANCNVQF